MRKHRTETPANTTGNLGSSNDKPVTGSEPSVKELRAVGRLLDSFRKHNNELSIADFARGEGVSRQLIYFQLSSVLRHLALSTDDVFERTGNGKRRLSLKGLQLQTELAEFVKQYDSFMRLGSRSNDRPSIRVGTTDTVSTRLLPIIRFHFEREVASDQTLGVAQPIIEQELNEPLTLLRMTQETSALDFAFTFVPDADSSNLTGKNLPCMPVDCCMLCRYDHEFARPNQRAAIESGNFDWTLLRTQTVVKPRANALLAAFPSKMIPSGVSKYIEVRTYLEAHAHVMMANTVAFSHRVLMSEEELKYIIPICLTRCGVKPVNLMLIPHVHRSKAAPADDSHYRICKIFEHVVKERMAEYAAETTEADNLYSLLSSYSSVTHSSIEYTGKTSDVVIMHGSMELDVIPARMSPLGDKSPFVVRGYHSVRRSVTGELSETGNVSFPIHGKIHVTKKGTSVEGVKQYHLMWQETEPGMSYGTVSIIFSSEDLAQGKPLIGRWLGRSSWCEDEFLPAGGGIILHQGHDELRSEKFRQLLLHHHDVNLALDWPHGLAANK